jgi:hypothetical protein
MNGKQVLFVFGCVAIALFVGSKGSPFRDILAKGIDTLKGGIGMADGDAASGINSGAWVGPNSDEAA